MLKASIPIIMLPFIPFFSITIIEINAPAANKVIGLERSPNPIIVGLFDGTVTPIILKPIIARNRPIPAPIPNFRDFGIALSNHARIGVKDIIKKSTPATRTAPSASAGV